MASIGRRVGWAAAAIGVALLAVIVLLLADCNLLRGPIAGYFSSKIGQKATIGSMSCRWGWRSTLTLRDIEVDNPSWAAVPKLARIGALELGIGWREAIKSRHATRLVLHDFDVDLERKTPDQVNWSNRPQPKNESGLPIQTVWFDGGRIHYTDAVAQVDARLEARSIQASEAADPGVAKAAGATAPKSPPAGEGASAATTLVTRIDFSGTYRKGKFSGSLGLGDTLGGDADFPIDLALNAGATKVDARGKTDATLSQIDVLLTIAGPTMANLYPFLVLPLPASPPYKISGQLTRDNTSFAFHDFSGLIGETQLAGTARYEMRENKPYLNIDVHSHVLNFADLGPLVGIHGAPGANGTEAQSTQQPSTAQADQLANGDAETAKAVENAKSPNRKVLPSGAFSGDKLRAIDADVKLVADQIKMPRPFAFESMNVTLDLHDGKLSLQPLQFGFAGGTLDSHVVLDGNPTPLAGSVQATVKQAKIARLFPTNQYMATSEGLLGAKVDLTGTGSSVAELLAHANGTAAAASSGGQVPSMIVDLIGLDAGALAKHKVTGEDQIPIRCIATVFTVRDGIANTDTMVIDTATRRIDGTGTINFRQEGLGLTFDPVPKTVSFPAARTPIHIDGTFAHPKVGIDKPSLALRGAATVALAVINPIAAVLPLIGTPTGKDADCNALLAQAQPARAQEHAESTAPPAPPAQKGSSH